MPKPRRADRPTPPPEPAPPVRDARSLLAGLLIFTACALLPIVGAAIQLDEQATPGVPAGRLLLAALLLAACLLQRTRRSARLAVPLGVMLLVGAVATFVPRPGPVVSTPVLGIDDLPYATHFPADLGAGIDELLRLGLLTLAALAAAGARTRWTLSGLALGAAIEGLRCLQEYLPALRGGDPTWRVFGGFGNPNQVASYLIVAIPLLLALAAVIGDEVPPAQWLTAHEVERPALKLRVLCLVLAALALLALGLTQSRGGLLALGVGFVAAVLGLLRAGRPKVALGVLATGGLMLVALALGPLRTRLLAGASLAHSNSFRVLTWLGTLDLARHFPLLGTGLGGWPVVYPIYARAGFTQHAHNGYLQVLAEGGVVSLLANLALFALWLRTAWRALGSAEPGRRALGLGLLAAVVAFAVHNGFDNGWYVTAVPLALILFAGSVAAGEGDEPRPIARGERVAVTLCGALLLLLLAFTALAENSRAAARDAAVAGLGGTAEDRARAATARAPWSGTAWESLAGVLSSRGDTAGAEAAYAEAIRRRPTTARLQYRLAAVLAEAGRVEEAVRPSAVSIALGPNQLQGYLQLGTLLERAGRPAEARRVYGRLDQVARQPELTVDDPLKDYLFQPTQGYGLMRLAVLAQAAGDRAAALDAAKRAIPVFDKYLATFRNLEAPLKGLPEGERRQQLESQGLHAAEREDVERLRAEAERIANSH